MAIYLKAYDHFVFPGKWTILVSIFLNLLINILPIKSFLLLKSKNINQN